MYRIYDYATDTWYGNYHTIEEALVRLYGMGRELNTRYPSCRLVYTGELG